MEKQSAHRGVGGKEIPGGSNCVRHSPASHAVSTWKRPGELHHSDISPGTRALNVTSLPDGGKSGSRRRERLPAENERLAVGLAKSQEALAILGKVDEALRERGGGVPGGLVQLILGSEVPRFRVLACIDCR